MSEYDHEPVHGLPEELPEGEHIVWQGAPDWKRLATSALHMRLVALYFAVFAVAAAIAGNFGTAAYIVVSAAIVLAMFAWYAWGVARTTVYTLTNRRIVLRIGVALNKCINIPIGEIDEANLKSLGGDAGSIVLKLKGMPRLGYLMLWPHARSLRMVRPQPMLRAIPQAEKVAALLLDQVRTLRTVAQREEAMPLPQGLAA